MRPEAFLEERDVPGQTLGEPLLGGELLPELLDLLVRRLKLLLRVLELFLVAPQGALRVA